MRLVIGSALVVRAASRLWIDPPLNVTIPAVLAIGAGILLIAGLWTPIVGTSVALIEIWKIIMLSGDKWVWLLLGTAGAALAMLGPGLWSSRCSPFRLEAYRSSAPRRQLSLSLRFPIYQKFLASEEGNIRSPKSLRFAPMWGCPQTWVG